MDGTCVYRYFTGNDESCSISFGGTFTLTSINFDTESCCDKITLYPSGALYSGVTGPNNVLASSMTWTTDVSVSSYGFYICAS